jgi:hypothetical protein
MRRTFVSFQVCSLITDKCLRLLLQVLILLFILLLLLLLLFVLFLTSSSGYEKYMALVLPLVVKHTEF